MTNNEFRNLLEKKGKEYTEEQITGIKAILKEWAEMYAETLLNQQKKQK